MDDFLTHGIATRGGNGYTDFNWSYTVFVQILEAKDVSSISFLDRVAESPIYPNDRLSSQTITSGNFRNGNGTSDLIVGSDGSDTNVASIGGVFTAK